MFLLRDAASAVIEMARAISETERRQAQLVEEGQTLREQFRFREFLVRRAADPGLTFREHLRAMRAAIEE